MTQDWRQSFTSLLQEFKEAAREHSDGLHLVVKDSPNTSLEALWARLDGHESLTNSTLAIATPCNERESAYFAATEATIDRFKELANLAACLLPIDMYPRDPIHEFTYSPVLVPGHVEWWVRFVYSTLRRHPGILFGIDDGSSRLIGNLPIAFLNVNIFAASAIAIEYAILTGAETEGTQQRLHEPAKLSVNDSSHPTAKQTETSKPIAVESIKRPPDMAMKAYRLRDLEGWTQTRIAKELVTNQGQVSKWVKAVRKYLAAGNILPDLGAMDKPQTVDPSVIEMGARSDGRTPRQRDKRSHDSDE